MRRAVAALSMLALVACGGGDDRELVGYTREPAPAVDTLSLPDVADGGAPFSFRGPEDGYLIVYFGFTNCPDACPTAMATVGGVREDLADDGPPIDLAMVSVDPDRDLDVLAGFVQGFVPGAHALATEDGAALRRAADTFGVSYEVTTAADGDVDVAHSDHLFAVDDAGRLALTWPSGVGRDDLVADLRQLADEQGDGAG